MKSVTILMYHSVSDTPAFFAVSADMFEAQMKYIHDMQLTAVFASELPGILGDDPSGRVCVTVDDGYADFFTNAFPILKKYGIKSTVFLITGLIGEVFTLKGHSAPLLNNDQIKELLASGLVEFMPHTHTHPNLDEIPLEKAVEEIERSRTYVAELTGREANIFAFPRGRYTRQVIDHLRSSGWRTALSVVRGRADKASDPLLLPRIAIDAVTSMRAFRAALSGSVLEYRILKSINFRLGLNI